MKIIATKKERIDKYLIEELNISRSYIQKLILNGNVTVNNEKINKNYITNIDDIIEYIIPENKELDIKKEDLDFEIVYEDDYLAVINKPKNLVVHPSQTTKEHTLVNGLLYKLENLSGINGVLRPGIVHRIDKDTTGLLMIAKNDFVHEDLSNQLKDHTVKRTYHAICYGKILHNTGKIDAPIGRSSSDRKKMAVTKDGKKAITHFKVLERFDDFTYIELNLETGRTHQIRVHMEYIGHPIIGDKLYGYKKVIGDNGQFLHAKTLGFIHPITKKEMFFDSKLPEYFTSFLESLRNKN